MQRPTERVPAGPSLRDWNDPRTECPVCGESIDGIESVRPGEHRFVGCGHTASGRFLLPAFGEDASA